MIHGKSVVAVITARGGSKGLPRKNVLELAGRPLIAWTIAAARASRYLDRFVLSSDDDEIIQVAREWECEVPFLRPATLATDEARSADVLLHALDALGESYDYAVLLQPTSPLRTAEDIDGALRECLRRVAPSCVSVSEPEMSPYWMFRMDADGRLHRLLDDGMAAHRRQNLPPVYALNGAVYVVAVPWFRERRTFVTPETVAYVMPPERSVDVDTAANLAAADALLAVSDS